MLKGLEMLLSMSCILPADTENNRLTFDLCTSEVYFVGIPVASGGIIVLALVRQKSCKTRALSVWMVWFCSNWRGWRIYAQGFEQASSEGGNIQNKEAKFVLEGYEH